MNAKTVGNDGESAAVAFIEQAGFNIIDTNVRPFPGMRRGEIDIIAWQGEILCIIEVKTRTASRFDAAEAITVTKRRQLTRLALAYIDKYRLGQAECRFDVICVYATRPGQPPDIQHIPGAFDPVY